MNIFQGGKGAVSTTLSPVYTTITFIFWIWKGT